MEVLEKEPNKVCVVPSDALSDSVRKTVSQKAFGTEKLCFQPGVPIVWQVQEILLRSSEQEPASIADTQPFKVRAPIGFFRAHCDRCYRAGFVTAVPA